MSFARSTVVADCISPHAETCAGCGAAEAQINVPPAHPGRLWKAIAFALRCPACDSLHHKAETGKRSTSGGLREQYRRCAACGIRFRVVWE
jgi:hypothetical protein